MKADVLAVEICFSLAAVPIRGEGIVRAETNQKSLRAVLLRCQGLPFLSSCRSNLWVCGICFFFHFFARFLQSTFPDLHTRGLFHTYHGILGKERRLGYYLGGVVFSLY